MKRLCKAPSLPDAHILRGFLQQSGIDVVNRDRRLEQGFDVAVDFEARGVTVEFGRGASRQPADRGRKITFVRTADKLVLETKRAGDFGATGQQRDNASLFQSASKR